MQRKASAVWSGDLKSGKGAMGHALAGISGGNEDVVAPRVAADEATVVDGVEHLARPARDLLA